MLGIFLGLLMMWLVFDQLWSVPAAVQMRKEFVRSVWLVAQFVREPSSEDLSVSLPRSYALREKITSSSDAVRASADGVVLEFGPWRERNLAWRSSIRDWQPQLRTLFLTRTALWKYRTRLPGFELPENVLVAQRDLDYASAAALDNIADRLEGKKTGQEADLQQIFTGVREAVQISNSERSKDSEAPLHAFLGLSNRSESLITSLDEQIRVP
jgi:multidrug resistance protein MdtO